MVKQFFEAENVEAMSWPKQIPYLNLIENIWNIIGNNVKAKNSWKQLCGRNFKKNRTKIIPEQSDKLELS